VAGLKPTRYDQAPGSRLPSRPASVCQFQGMHPGDVNAARTRARCVDGGKNMVSRVNVAHRAATHVQRPFWVRGGALRSQEVQSSHDMARPNLSESAIRSGKPCIKGSSITVYDVLEYLAGGMTEDEILGDFPDLTRDDIRAALGFAAARERRLANSEACAGAPDRLERH
jgi:uncharacterized protein (DUF433 family)